MIPRTFLSTYAVNGQQQMVVAFLDNITGLTRWVDYIPVKLAQGGRENSYDNNGFIDVAVVAKSLTSVPFKDYVPVYADTAATDAWQVNFTGYIPYGYAGSGDASLMLDFTSNFQAFDSRITFTRVSTATYFNSSGLLTSAATNTPRLDYNPATLAAQGLLIEEQRTNSIRNNTMVGAVAGTPGTDPTNWSVDTPGLTTSVVGTGTQNGVTYIDVRLNGTTSAGYGNIFFEPTNGIAATNNQTWAHSLWLSVVGGSTTNVSTVRHAFDLYSSVPGYLSTVVSNLVGVSATQTRYGAALTTNNASTAFVRPSLSLLWSTGAAIDITLRIGLPQLEQGAFATSVIPTTTTALTRAADVASVNTLSPWYNASEGTLYAEYNIPYALAVGSAPRLFSLMGAGGPSIDDMPFVVNKSSGKAASFNAFTGGVSAGRIDATPAFVENTVTKAAAAYAVNDRAVTANASSPTTSTTVYTIPTITMARLGGQDSTGNNSLNGYLRRITYYPRKLSSAELQSITT